MKYFFSLVLVLLFGCDRNKRFLDELPVKNIPRIEASGLADIIAFQEKLNGEFKDPETSPLPDRYRKNFIKLDFFEPDTTYRVVARLERTPNALPFLMPTTTERKSEEVVYGIAYFTLDGKEQKLEIYQGKETITKEGFENYLFLPFTDNTNGEETYAGGRYIDLSIPKGDSIVIDFNKAYNPYCVYNKKYSCPIVPSINHINTSVLAGIKDFNKAVK